MPTMVQKLKNQIKKLPASQRAELAHFLIETLGQEDEGHASGLDKELAERVKEIKSGRARGTPPAKVFARLRENF